jgi:hypothetical protein
VRVKTPHTFIFPLIIAFSHKKKGNFGDRMLVGEQTSSLFLRAGKMPTPPRETIRTGNTAFILAYLESALYGINGRRMCERNF